MSPLCKDVRRTETETKISSFVFDGATSGLFLLYQSQRFCQPFDNLGCPQKLHGRQDQVEYLIEHHRCGARRQAVLQHMNAVQMEPGAVHDPKRDPQHQEQNRKGVPAQAVQRRGHTLQVREVLEDIHDGQRDVGQLNDPPKEDDVVVHEGRQVRKAQRHGAHVVHHHDRRQQGLANKDRRTDSKNLPKHPRSARFSDLPPRRKQDRTAAYLVGDLNHADSGGAVQGSEGPLLHRRGHGVGKKQDALHAEPHHRQQADQAIAGEQWPLLDDGKASADGPEDEEDRELHQSPEEDELRIQQLVGAQLLQRRGCGSQRLPHHLDTLYCHVHPGELTLQKMPVEATAAARRDPLTFGVNVEISPGGTPTLIGRCTTAAVRVLW
eukprot:scaffold3665_cov244-Pinguiococcus_pyrenoidosus.AAC.2